MNYITDKAAATTEAKHYIVAINPTAEHDWQRCEIHEVLSFNRPSIESALLNHIDKPGRYLVRLRLEIEVMESCNEQ